MNTEAALLALLFGGAYYWFAALRAREKALALCRETCRREGLQLLDDTLRCVRMGLGRDGSGRARVRRNYRFEFSATGANRREGELVLLGAQLESLQLEPYEATAQLH